MRRLPHRRRDVGAAAGRLRGRPSRPDRPAAGRRRVARVAIAAALGATSLTWVCASDAGAAKKPTTAAKARRAPTTSTRRTTARVTTSLPTSTSAAPLPSSAARATAPAPVAPPSAPSAPATQPCRPVRLLPLGDSLTAFPDSYRGPLYRRLVAEHHDVDFVGSLSWEPTGGGDPDGEGHGGFTIGPDASVDFQGKPANLADNIDTWIPAARPDVIVLTIGANDLATGGSAPAQAPDKLRRLVGRLQALAPSAVIVIGDVPPARYDLTGTGIVKPLNDTARALAEANTGDRILYAPTFKRLLDAGFRLDTDTVDGQHFSTAGGIKFADAFYPTVVAALARTSTC